MAGLINETIMLLFIILVAAASGSEIENGEKATELNITEKLVNVNEELLNRTKELLNETECFSCVEVSSKCHNVTHIFDLQAKFRNHVVIHKLSILRSEKILFYSFEPEISDPEYYKVGFVDLDDSEKNGVLSGSVTLIMNFGPFDIDQDNHIVYLGGSNGISMLDTRKGILTSFSSRGDTITNVFFKNNVYFTREHDKGIIEKRGDYFKTHLEYVEVDKFVITKNDVIVFTNTFGLFVSKRDLSQRISKKPFFRGLVIDLDGVVYAWWVDGIYKVVIDNFLINSYVIKIADLQSIGIGGMSFDNQNNIIFVADQHLYTLTETKSNCSKRCDDCFRESEIIH